MNELVIDVLRREIFRLEQQLDRMGESDSTRYYRQELQETLERRRRLLDRYQGYDMRS
jgi:hypothetical protein